MLKNRSPIRPIALLTALLAGAVLVPAAAPAQSAQDVLQRAIDQHRSQTEHIDNYTVVQTVMGFETTTYFEKETVDGEPVFVPRMNLGSEAGEQVPANPYRLYSTLAERARLEGTETVDGEECHVIVVTDFSGTEMASPGAASSGEWTPERMQMFVDTDEHLSRKMVFEGTVTENGDRRPVSFTVHLRDYREVEGLVHPFRMEMTTQGLSPQISEEERAQMRQSMEQMREQMAQMSPEQREMMERMMGGKMEKMEKMLTSGAMDVTVEVQEIRVNEGPPSEGS